MKCLFDNNMPSKLAKTLNFLEGDDGITVEHLKDKFPPDTPDIEWIKKLAKEGNWFVITQDNQIRKRSHERKAWQESNIPIVFLQKAWISHDLWGMAWRLIRYWPNLKENIKRSRKNESLLLTINGKITAVGG
jgi:predicted nuclease of predicted toxin-antitoxin system